jgi:hypothetical protein
VQERRERGHGGQGGVQAGDLVGERVAVAGGECDIAAPQGLAAGQVGAGIAAAQGLGVAVDAGDVLAQVDGGVVALHKALQPTRVGYDLPGQPLVLAEFFKPPERIIGGRAGQRAVVVLVDEGEQVLAAGNGLLAFDFSAEPAVAGPGVALEELYGLMPVLQCPRDDPA